MKQKTFKIGVISDTHGHLEERVKEVFAGVDHILHAGDIGDLTVLDGLSAVAAQSHAQAVLNVLLPGLQTLGLSVAPLLLATQARVALADEAAELLGVKLVIHLIGERPGLSSPDSLGAYLTCDPKPGTLDSARNCVSNIRPAGLDAGVAARRLLYLTGEALRRGLSGVGLKDDSVEVGETLELESG